MNELSRKLALTGVFAYDLAFWAFHCFCMAKFLPEVVNTLPATGGDTASHFWPVVVLREYGIPHFDWRPWNPGNYAGEPLLVHYFPLPFLIMGFASYFMPAGLAFNLGTFLPVMLTPPAVWWCARRLAPAFGASTVQAGIGSAFAGIFSLAVLFNDGNTMWGGNFFSVLAGQFCHQYAFVWFFTLLGLMPSAIQSRRSQVCLAIAFAGVVTSHAYVALFIPIAFAGAVFTLRIDTFWSRTRRLLEAGILGALMSAWFWWPLIDNSKWTTPYGFSWQFTGYVKELIPLPTALLLTTLTLGLIACLFSWSVAKASGRALMFWLLQIFAGIIGYFTFAKLGLVDVRTIPQIHYSAAFLAGFILTNCLQFSPTIVRNFALVLLLGLPVAQWYLAKDQITTLQNWVRWNYSSWVTKEAYPSLKALSHEISGDFNDPRVAFEHDGQSNIAGTPRVFEMLPYFAGRGVNDGVYMQSTIVAPMSFYHQATISKNPSCPFPNYSCSKIDIAKGLGLGRLMGVGTYILRSDEVVNMAKQNRDLELLLTAKPWQIFRDKDPTIGYVTIPTEPPEWIDGPGWRERFWQWWNTYQAGNRFLAVRNHNTPANWASGQGLNCAPTVHVEFSKITLDTQCPGILHVLRFAFHSSWKSANEDPTFNVSPGFIGIIPKSQHVELRFGQLFSWKVATWISIFAVLGTFWGWIRLRRD